MHLLTHIQSLGDSKLVLNSPISAACVVWIAIQVDICLPNSELMILFRARDVDFITVADL